MNNATPETLTATRDAVIDVLALADVAPELATWPAALKECHTKLVAARLDGETAHADAYKLADRTLTTA